MYETRVNDVGYQSRSSSSLFFEERLIFYHHDIKSPHSHRRLYSVLKWMNWRLIGPNIGSYHCFADSTFRLEFKSGGEKPRSTTSMSRQRAANKSQKQQANATKQKPNNKKRKHDSSQRQVSAVRSKMLRLMIRTLLTASSGWLHKGRSNWSGITSETFSVEQTTSGLSWSFRSHHMEFTSCPRWLTRLLFSRSSVNFQSQLFRKSEQEVDEALRNTGNMNLCKYLLTKITSKYWKLQDGD